jgi:UDP-perosamine 4-acetyltransferase
MNQDTPLSDGSREMTKVLIWGGGGHGKVVADIARAMKMEVVGFADADSSKLGKVVEAGGARVVVSQNDLVAKCRENALPSGAEKIVLGVGDNAARGKCRQMVPAEFLATVVHPSATVSPSARIEAGVVIMGSAVINASASIGAGSVVNTGAIVEHDCQLGVDVHVAPGAVLTGSVTVGARTLVGAGAVVIPSITIGSDATIGAGSVVLSAVGDGSTVAGNPAKLVK